MQAQQKVFGTNEADLVHEAGTSEAPYFIIHGCSGEGQTVGLWGILPCGSAKGKPYKNIACSRKMWWDVEGVCARDWCRRGGGLIGPTSGSLVWRYGVHIFHHACAGEGSY